MADASISTTYVSILSADTASSTLLYSYDELKYGPPGPPRSKYWGGSGPPQPPCGCAYGIADLAYSKIELTPVSTLVIEIAEDPIQSNPI